MPGDPDSSPFSSEGVTLPGAGPFASGIPAAGNPKSTTFGRFVLERELGRGGMGIVYAARDVNLGRVVALKTVFALDPYVLRRLELEARAIASLNHPGIVTVHEVGQFEGRPYFTMELVDGASLDAILRSGRLSMTEIEVLARRVGGAIAHAHERRIVHRDLKPANVLVPRRTAVAGAAQGFDLAEARVGDFGLARDLSREAVTASGQMVGTAAYMPPEQARGDLGRIDERSDVYSFAAILYECLTGRPPHTGSSWGDILVSVLTRPIPPARQLDPQVPAVWSDALARAMAAEPEDRFASISALLAALQGGGAGSAASGSDTRVDREGADLRRAEEEALASLRGYWEVSNRHDQRIGRALDEAARMRAEVRALDFREEFRRRSAARAEELERRLLELEEAAQYDQGPELARGVTDEMRLVASTDVARVQRILQRLRLRADTLDACRSGRDSLEALMARDGTLRNALAWLARHQEPDGHWDPAGFTVRCRVAGQGDRCTGAGNAGQSELATAVALLALLHRGTIGAGCDNVTGEGWDPARSAQAAARWLADRPSGRLMPLLTEAVCGLALVEACRRGEVTGVREATQRTVRRIAASPANSLTWRAMERADNGTVEAIGWCLLALETARRSGFETRSEGRATLHEEGELRDPETTPAVGVLWHRLVQGQVHDPLLEQRANRLLDAPSLKADARPIRSYHAWLFSTLAFRIVGGPDGPGGRSAWPAWRDRLSAALLPMQEPEPCGCACGSWPPARGSALAPGGRVLSTALAALSLEALVAPPGDFGIGAAPSIESPIF